SAILPQLPGDAQLLCVGTNAMATAAMLKAGAQRGATGENSVRWAAERCIFAGIQPFFLCFIAQQIHP
ncbi:MAG: DUF3842 family protein, partial [Peptococcaceae bacterium]|nr:DUF3842 family protein [Peptococcaceae bacterium]